MKISQIIKGSAICLLTTAATVFGAGIVSKGTESLEDFGTAENPAYWNFSSDFISYGEFTIGYSNRFSSGHYNILTVENAKSFLSLDDLVVGPVASSYNELNIETGGEVYVGGDANIGTGNVSYSSHDNAIHVAGELFIGGDFNIGSRTAHSGVIGIEDGGIVQIIGDFNLYSHWAYNNSWLELNGGLLALEGDRRSNFTEGSSILGSIKVWDDISGEYKVVADYTGAIDSSTVPTAYAELLSVEYVTDGNDELFGYTVVKAVPEPGCVALLAFGGVGMLRRMRR